MNLVLRSSKGRSGQVHKRKGRHRDFSTPRVILVTTVISLTSAVGYQFYNEPQLAVGTAAPQTLRAPDSASIEDKKTTEDNRHAARMGAIPVLMVDNTVNAEIYQSLQRFLDEGDELRQSAGAFPFVETSVLSTTVQQYLRQTSDKQWLAVTDIVEGNLTDNDQLWKGQPIRENSSDNPGASSHQLAVIELQNYYRTHSPEDFLALKQVILRSRQRYTSAIAQIAAAPAEQPSVFQNSVLLNLTDAQWAETRIGIRQVLDRVLLQGIPPGLPSGILEQAIKAQLDIAVPPDAIQLASRILLAVSKPNLIEDPDKTQLQAEQAAQAIQPEMVTIRRGEVIVRAGETITQSDFVLLDYFGLSRRSINWWALVGLGVWVLGAVGIFLLVERRFHPGLRRRDYILVWLLTLSTPLLIALNSPFTSLPLVGLLVGSFYGSALGVTVVGLLGITLPMGMDIAWTHLIASTVGSLVGACRVGRSRSREELALLGFSVGLVQGIVYLVLGLLISSPGPGWYAVLTFAGVQGLIGLAWSVVALGISPYLERLFDLVTPIRLAELSNPNRPLLKRLASEAPGTFQHTLFVSSLAESAARALGCNVELVRAGTLYHDIGKMHDALGFIENQMGGPNKHDLINDPWISATLIKKHVSEGIIMAKRYRLPTAIQDFIPEHQGTMLITYFYHAALQRAKEQPGLVVNEADFRYDGPVPQSRETGIVMLADSCEAALRSLKDATPAEALAMVNRILRARWQDHQLVDSGLTRAEMACIAEIFVSVWQQFNHQRIAYPKLTPSPQPSPVGTN